MPRRGSAGKVLAGAAIVIAPLVGAQWALQSTPLFARQLVLCAWGVGATLFFERLFFSDSLHAAWRAIGFAPARGRVVAIGLLVTVPMWLLLPVLCGLNGIPIAVRPDWPVIVLGVILVNGITEEVLHRGFVFRRLRLQSSFSRAAAIGAAVFAAQHLYLIITLGWPAGVASVVLAALLTWPLAYVHEQGGNSIATPAILHTSANAPMLILESPDGALTAVLVPYMAGVLGSIYLVFLFRGFVENAARKTKRRP